MYNFLEVFFFVLGQFSTKKKCTTFLVFFFLAQLSVRKNIQLSWSFLVSATNLCSGKSTFWFFQPQSEGSAVHRKCYHNRYISLHWKQPPGQTFKPPPWISTILLKSTPHLPTHTSPSMRLQVNKPILREGGGGKRSSMVPRYWP